MLVLDDVSNFEADKMLTEYDFSLKKKITELGHKDYIFRTLNFFKDTLMQIWKSPCMLVFTYVNYALKILHS